LYNRGQQNSFANLLGKRFEMAGGGTFTLPDINASNGFNVSLNDLSNAFDPSAANFGRFFLDLSIPGPSPTSPGDALTPYAGDNAEVDNLGVPGMRLVELTANGYGQLNPFYARFATDPAGGSVLGQALAKQPTFMTFWLGNNDALSWATGGGVGATGVDDMGNPDPSGDAIPNSLVSTASFNATLDGSLGALYGTYPELKGVILNIPNITVIPFFQAVRYNAIPLDAATAAAASAGYAGYNQVLDGLVNPALGPLAITQEEADMRKISFSAGNNAVVVVDDNLTDLTNAFDFLATLPQAAGGITAEQRAALQPLILARQLKSTQEMPVLANFGLGSEILTLSAGSVLGTLADPNNPASVIGVGVPLGDNFTLTADEIGLVLTRIGQFNAKIAAVAAANPNLALFDANAFFTGIAVNRGITRNEFTYTPDFSPNGVFSTDGIHPNPAGHAILANELMKVIEASYGAVLPEYDVTEFTTVVNR
ncbi:MAG: hypothetical protein WBA74_24890, partial [Cyclobacteriaceae bacterium]